MAVLSLLAGCSQAEEGAISLDNLAVPRDQVISGGPPKDGIPALTDPAVVSAASAASLASDDRVIGLSLDGESRAYPLKILNWHELVNDTLGDQPVLVTYCPLCDSAVVFHRVVDEKTLEFGVSGLLYQSNVLMYDRSRGPQSLWSQLAGRALSGPFVGTRLPRLPIELSTWGDWISEHPETTVLAPETGFVRSYDQNPYTDYFRSPRLMFPVSASDARLPAKTRILGIEIGGESKAYPLPDPDPARGEWQDTLGGQQLRFKTDPKSGNVRLLQPPPEAHISYSLWYAWYAFYQSTRVHSYSP